MNEISTSNRQSDTVLNRFNSYSPLRKGLAVGVSALLLAAGVQKLEQGIAKDVHAYQEYQQFSDPGIIAKYHDRQINPDSAVVITVQPNDTPYDLGQKYGNNPDNQGNITAEITNQTQNQLLHPNQELVLPADQVNPDFRSPSQ